MLILLHLNAGATVLAAAQLATPLQPNRAPAQNPPNLANLPVPTEPQANPHPLQILGPAVQTHSLASRPRLSPYLPICRIAVDVASLLARHESSVVLGV